MLMHSIINQKGKKTLIKKGFMYNYYRDGNDNSLIDYLRGIAPNISF